jgi:hypothetical protein
MTQGSHHRRTDNGQRRGGPGFVGLVLAAIGAVLAVIGATSLDWYSNGPAHLKLRDLHDAAKAVDVGLMKAYGSYLVWVLLAAVVLAAVLASLPARAAVAFRVIAPLVGVVAVVLTLLALNGFFDKAREVGATDVGIFKHSDVGLYLTLAGFVIAGVAGVFGKQRP